MASKAKVAVGLLPATASGTVDLTVSGFGTVDAAIVVCGNANSTNNPESEMAFSVGFWDGVNSVQHVAEISSEDNASTTDSYRGQLTNKILSIYGPSSNQILVDATCSAVTDGIRLTVGTDNTGVERYVFAILIGGTTDVHLGTRNLGTGTSAVDITDPGFKPDIVFVSCVGAPIPQSAGGQHAIFSLGVVHNSPTDVVTQGVAYAFSEDLQASTSDTGVRVSHSYCAGQFFNNTVSWQASASAFDSSGFSLTPTASTSSDHVSYLAIKLATPADAWVDVIDAKTSTGNDAHTGLGFSPDLVGLISTLATSLDTTTAGLSLAFGAADDTRERCIAVHDEDNVATSNSGSEADTSNVFKLLTEAGAADAVASLSSLDSDGFTLNYSDAAASAKKILAFAIGDSTAGAGFSPYWAAGSNVIMNNGSP